jgi:hypothetical protein
MRDSLAKHQIETPLSDDEIYQKKRKAWLQGEGIHLNAAQIKVLSLEHRWFIEIIGNLVYGKAK